MSATSWNVYAATSPECQSFVGNGDPYLWCYGPGTASSHHREYVEQDQDSIVQYLKNDWLGRGWVNLSDTLASVAIARQISEIFANARSRRQESAPGHPTP
jgi:hypothetical protein